MVLCALDPSFKRTGIAMYKEGTLYVRNSKVADLGDKSFQAVWRGAEIQSEMIARIIELTVGKVDFIISECPPPQGQYSPGLYALDSLLFKRLRSCTQSLWVLYPNYIGHVHGKRNYTKTESVQLAQRMLEALKNKVTVDIESKRISHDESEAVIFLCRLFVINNMFIDELAEFKGLFSDKQKELY